MEGGEGGDDAKRHGEAETFPLARAWECEDAAGGASRGRGLHSRVEVGEDAHKDERRQAEAEDHPRQRAAGDRRRLARARAGAPAGTRVGAVASRPGHGRARRGSR